MKTKATLILFLLFSTSVFAQEFRERQERRAFTTTIEAEVFKPVQFEFKTSIKLGWEATDKIVPLKSKFDVPPQVSYVISGNTVFCWAPPGDYEIVSEQTLINWTKQDIDQREFSVHLHITGNIPPGPTPPDPPQPPTPVADNPFGPASGLNILFIEEKDKRADIPQEQLLILSSKEVTDYLNSHKFDYQIHDQNTTMPESSKWAKALRIPNRTSDFWVVISNGQKWESLPLPKNISEMMTLLRKYGG